MQRLNPNQMSSSSYLPQSDQASSASSFSSSAAPASTQQLPTGWEEHFSETHQRPYYRHIASGNTQWGRPEIPHARTSYPSTAAQVANLSSARRASSTSRIQATQSQKAFLTLQFDSNVPQEICEAVTFIAQCIGKEFPPHHPVSIGISDETDSNHAETITNSQQRRARVNFRPKFTSNSEKVEFLVTALHELVGHLMPDLKAMYRNQSIADEDEHHRMMLLPADIQNNEYYAAALDVHEELPKHMQREFLQMFAKDVSTHMQYAQSSEQSDIEDFLDDIYEAHDIEPID